MFRKRILGGYNMIWVRVRVGLGLGLGLEEGKGSSYDKGKDAREVIMRTGTGRGSREIINPVELTNRLT